MTTTSPLRGSDADGYFSTPGLTRGHRLGLDTISAIRASVGDMNYSGWECTLQNNFDTSLTITSYAGFAADVVPSVAGALSISSMNWLRFGVIIIWVRRLS